MVLDFSYCFIIYHCRENLPVAGANRLKPRLLSLASRPSVAGAVLLQRGADGAGDTQLRACGAAVHALHLAH
eukprot:86751-Prorocentrum_minimum.AAC.1